ncbi:MAG: hypothetical protein AAGC99_14945 [Pseudomonadota bacterium]
MAKRPYSIQELKNKYKENQKDGPVSQDLLYGLDLRSTPRGANLKRRTAPSHDLISPRKNWSAPSTRSAEFPIRQAMASAPPETIILTGERTRPQSVSVDPKSAVKTETQSILHAWTALEVLSPPRGFRRESDLTAGDESRIAHLHGEQLHWERGETSHPQQRLYYELILGTIDLDPAIAKLLNVYADDRPDEPRIAGRAALASILLDKNGRPLEGQENSAAISTFAWGLPLALQGNLKALADWPFEEKALVNALRKKLIRHDENNKVIPLDRTGIDELYALLIGLLGLEDQDTTPPHFAVRRFDDIDNDAPPEPEFVNSFFIQDLIQARDLADQSSLPRILQFYLGEAAPSTRTDLLEDEDGLRTLLQPAFTPLGRWPGPGRHPLAPLQQAAVNGTSDGLEDTGFFAVDGLPDTGKTALVRDIIAARIVERAEVMAEYDDPNTAFSPTSQVLQRGGGGITLHHVDERLKGFEMVVASSNDKAVENASFELSALEAVASDAIGLRYFSSISDTVLGRATWGCITAVLGNASNRFEFARDFWRDEEHGLATYLDHASGAPQSKSALQDDDQPAVQRPRHVALQENPPKDRHDAMARWHVARENFLQAAEKARKTRGKLQHVYQALAEAHHVQRQIAKIEGKIPEVESIIDQINSENEEALGNLDQRSSSLYQALRRLSDLNKHKPGYWSRLLRTKLARDWQAKRESLLADVHDRHEEKAIAEDQLQQIAQTLNKQRSMLNKLTSTRQRLETEQLELEDRISASTEDLNAPIPDSSFFDDTHEAQQLAHLWFDEAAHAERDHVFETAMALHRAFIDCAADPIRKNLAIFTETFATKSLGTIEKDALIPDLWSTFFLVVPVVSATFASAHRLFSGLGPETLGWLLIDEAGQAAPQAAVGAIMRAKRAVVIGDPLQTEPVVTLPEALTEEICAQFGIDTLTYNAPEASVQTLAESASFYCARFPIDSDHRNVCVA